MLSIAMSTDRPRTGWRSRTRTATRWAGRGVIASAVVFFLAMTVPRVYTIAITHGDVYGRNVPASSSPRVGIVFGAGIHTDNTPTPILTDRVTAAAKLYKDGKVDKLLMSGDNRRRSYNEPEVMKQLAIGLGVPATDIALDYAGRRTYDTCWRAVNVFGVDHAVLVTQRYHMARALYLCQGMGIDAVGRGLTIDAYSSAHRLQWRVRELPAAASAVADLNLLHPKPVPGKRIDIWDPCAVHASLAKPRPPAPQGC
jgi:vancomycin permeability regulator SanA